MILLILEEETTRYREKRSVSESPDMGITGKMRFNEDMLTHHTIEGIPR